MKGKVDQGMGLLGWLGPCFLLCATNWGSQDRGIRDTATDGLASKGGLRGPAHGPPSAAILSAAAAASPRLQLPVKVFQDAHHLLAEDALAEVADALRRRHRGRDRQAVSHLGRAGEGRGGWAMSGRGRTG